MPILTVALRIILFLLSVKLVRTAIIDARRSMARGKVGQAKLNMLSAGVIAVGISISVIGILTDNRTLRIVGFGIFSLTVPIWIAQIVSARSESRRNTESHSTR